MKATQTKFLTVENDDNDYKKFINNISDGDALPFETSIGYLLSEYDPNKKMIVVIHGSEASGKGLFSQGLSEIRKLVRINDKDLYTEQCPYFNAITSETDILSIDDIKEDFQIDQLYGLLNNGFIIEKRDQEPFRLEPEDSPKLLVSTKYCISQQGQSHTRRVFNLKFSDHYGAHHTPMDEFGHELFNDWDLDHRNRFENYMENCIQKYIEHGLVKQQEG